MKPAVATGHRKCAICGVEIRFPNKSHTVTAQEVPKFVAFAQQFFSAGSVVCQYHLSRVGLSLVPTIGLQVVDANARRGQRSEHVHDTRFGGPSTRGDLINDRTESPTPEEFKEMCLKFCEVMRDVVRNEGTQAPSILPSVQPSRVLPDVVYQQPERWIGLPDISDLQQLTIECKMEDTSHYSAEFRLAVSLVYLVSGNCMDQVGDLFKIPSQRVSEFCKESREKLLAHVVPQWLRPETPEELKTAMPAQFRDAYDDFAAIVDTTLVYVEKSIVPSLRAQEFSYYKAAQAVKLLIIVSLTGWIIDIVGQYSPDRSADSLCVLEHITQDTSFRQYLFDTCCQTHPHRHGVIGDLGFTDIRDTLARIDLPPDHRLRLPCGHRLFMRLPAALEGRSRLPEAEAQDSQFVTAVRQLVERSIRRVKSCRLFRRELPIQITPSFITQWAKIAACLGNRYRNVMTDSQME